MGCVVLFFYGNSLHSTMHVFPTIGPNSKKIKFFLVCPDQNCSQRNIIVIKNLANLTFKEDIQNLNRVMRCGKVKSLL